MEKNMSCIFQAFHLEPLYTVYDNVRMPLLIRGIEDKLHKKEIQRTLELVGLAKKEKAKAATLSGGEKQRVAIARAIVADAKRTDFGIEGEVMPRVGEIVCCIDVGTYDNSIFLC